MKGVRLIKRLPRAEPLYIGGEDDGCEDGAGEVSRGDDGAWEATAGVRDRLRSTCAWGF